METYSPYLSLPGITPEELTILHHTINDLDENQKQRFHNIYLSKRRNPQDLLIFALLGLVGIAGVHRIIMGQVTMGVLYLFTAGFFFVGTVMDLINYKSLANEYNQQMAYESMNIAKMNF